MLVVPAAAHAAATYTVKPNSGACGAPSDLVCGNLVEAAGAAANGDTFNLTKATYEGAEFKKSGLTINGEPGVAINGTMTFSAATGAVNKLSKVALSAGTAAAPGILVNGASSLELSDSIILSKDGHGVLITAGTKNKIVRSVIITGGAAASAVRIETKRDDPNNDLNKGLTLESTILTGGAAGLGVRTECLALLDPPAGDVNVIARHITAAGSTNGIVLDSSDAARALSAGAGNITTSLTDSIALNNKTTRYAVLGGENEAKISADTRSLQTADEGTLFADPTSRNYRLRPNSPAIGKGGFTAGESATDIDGDPRPGPTTDLGADEFVNAPPIAAIKVATQTPRNGKPVIFDGRGSSDRESGYGGGIVKYQWNFGDGQTQETATPAVQHIYPSQGSTVVQLVVVDNFGAASAVASVPITISDGTPPEVRITKPVANQTLKLVTVTKSTVTNNKGKKTTTTARKKLRLGFAGTAKDSAGVANVVLFIEKLAATSASKGQSTAKAKASQAAKSAKCTWLDPKRGLIVRSCSRPFFILARLAKDGTWTYNVSTKIKQPSAGTYRVIASGVDSTGAAGNSAPAKEAIIRFTLKK
ncbi:MAG TPA: PKD domain-containing protein [Solirubrobacteraceae bacterium]